MVDTGTHPDRNPVFGRLQKESCASTAPTAATAAGSNGFAFSESELGR
jgi:hypothetical protein